MSSAVATLRPRTNWGESIVSDAARPYARQRAEGSFTVTALEYWAAQRLIRPLQFLRRRVTVTAALGVLTELVLMAAMSPSALDAPKGTPGAVGVAIAVVAAIAAGGIVGALVALAGWWALFLLVTEREPVTLIALPVFVGVAILVGLLSDALLKTRRELDRRELDRIASHELRTPIATIAGLTGVLRGRELPPGEARLVEIIDLEAPGLLESFDEWRAEEFEIEDAPARTTERVR